MRRAALMAVLLLGCGGSELEIDSDSELEADAVPAGIDDSFEESQALADGTTQVVFVNFNGPTISNCDGCSSAPRNRSFVIGRMWGRSSVDFAPYTNADGKEIILARLRRFFEPWRIRFTSVRPDSGKYTMVIISPTLMAHHGVAPLDCGNANRNDIAFVVHTGDTGFYPGPGKIAQAAAHELGHSFGLSHVVQSDEIMQWASSGQTFGRAGYDTAHPSGKCFGGSVQDAPELLRLNIGRD
jgi:hypothetical protein